MESATRRALDALFADLDAAVSSAGPVCRASGRCCRFGEYGHTLFLSRLEAERLLEEGLPERAVVSPASCPFQVGGLCTARERRPMGCRVYFCDPEYQERGRELAEEFINHLKRLHDHLGIGWEYRPLHAFLEGRQPQDEGVRETSPLPVLGELS